MSAKASLESIEREMRDLKSTIDATNDRIAPLRAELAVLLEEEQAIRARVAVKVAEINAARGEDAGWLALKRRYGQLAAARMTLRQL